MYEDNLQVMAPADDCDAAAALHHNYPRELTDGTACCTSSRIHAHLTSLTSEEKGRAVSYR